MVKKGFFIFKLKDAEGHERMYDLAMSDVFLAWNECSEKFFFTLFSLHLYTNWCIILIFNRLVYVENSVEKKFSTPNVFLYIHSIKISIVNC